MLTLRFDNRFIEELPGDPETGNRIRQVQGALWSTVMPTPVASPSLLAWSPEVATLLDWTETDIRQPAFTEVFAGNRLLPGMQPFATNYGGHQFGGWADQLGDGRAISLGETVNSQGQRWELQLKGAGLTPYSRRADGRAVLRSSLREFLCSEAMHHLGIPTTRALSLVGTGEGVVRDMFYDGHPQVEPGAVLCRVAPSFIRFGHFELPAARGDKALLEQLVDFTIRRDYPELQGNTQQKRTQWYLAVCYRTAVLIAHWMRTGFVHGVMNTDNLSILGLTLDYGPYGWLEEYDPLWTPNTTDAQGRRYCYSQQPYIGYWNLARLRDALRSVIADTEMLNSGLQHYTDTYSDTFGKLLADKFGIATLSDNDAPWINTAFELMHQSEVDMTLFFRQLADITPDNPGMKPLLPAFYREALREQYREAWENWLQQYLNRLQADGLSDNSRRERMNAVNPRFVLRNYLAQQAIDLATAGDTGRIMELLNVLRHPYTEQPHYARFAEKRPEWARHKAGCSMLSCSS